ncbi:retrovirus-related Pol polyprotein from transposon 412 [Trichonephila clavipes]|nr:retrovirus-related Pol polyprotein from transposon 412 [Trichonephila clavipes]
MMNRISICKAFLAKRNEMDPFIKWMVTGDEKWDTYDNIVKRAIVYFHRLYVTFSNCSTICGGLFWQRIKLFWIPLFGFNHFEPPKTQQLVSESGVRTHRSGLRSFLGLCTYYQKFVKGFSNIARPLHKLTESKQKFQWTKECEDSFLQLKALTSSPILIYPQPDKPFILDTDASNESVEVLSPGNRWPGTSRSLLENTEGQVARWIQRLNEYYFDIRHRKGSSHGNADALSRRPCPENCRHCSRVCLGVLSNKPNWPRTSRLIVLQLSSIGLWNSLHLRNGVLYRKIRIRGWKDIQVAISTSSISYPRGTQELHGSPTGGHFGVMKTLHRVRERFCWGKVS